MLNSPCTTNSSHASHWYSTASPASFPAHQSEDIEVDFVVVGGGLTGCRTALGLAESGARVVLLEANNIGWGASGRSGGQCNPMLRATPEQLVERMGNTIGNNLVEATIASADALFDDIERYGINCDGEQTGWVQAAHSKSARKSLEQLGGAWLSAGSDIMFLERADVQSVSGSNAYGFGLFHKRGGHVQPLSLTRGFAQKAAEYGAQIFEHSPVTSMSKDSGRWIVQTQHGRASAAQVILTTNAYSDNLWPQLRKTYYPLVSIALATTPLTLEQQRHVLPNAVTIADTRRAIYFSRYDRDRRLIFGCVGSNNNPESFGGIGRLKTGLKTVFPQLSNQEIESHWAGRIAVTDNMMPRLFEPDSGVVAALGFSGRGIAMTSVMARTLVNKALGANDDSLPFPVSRIKPVKMHSVAEKLIPLAAPAMTIRDKIDTWVDPL